MSGCRKAYRKLLQSTYRISRCQITQLVKFVGKKAVRTFVSRARCGWQSVDPTRSSAELTEDVRALSKSGELGNRNQ